MAVRALLLLTLGATGVGASRPAPGDLPREATVAAATLRVRAEPRSDALALGVLHPGDRITVVDVDESGNWLTIRPPDDAFAWIAQSTVRPEGPLKARVSASTSEIRFGVSGSDTPGPPSLELERGAIVRLADRPPRVEGTGAARKTWIAIAAPPQDVRFVPSSGVDWPRPVAVQPTAEVRTSFEPPNPGTAPGDAIASVESDHRAVLAGPMEGWRFESVKARYLSLRNRDTDPETRAAIDARLDLVDRHEAMARSARAFSTIVARSRRRDLDVQSARKTVGQIGNGTRRPFVAEGLIQPSSRQVDGRRVFALIGTEGSPIAYLDIPAGLDARPLMAKRVGVRGTVSYDETLRSKLIAVRDLESLE